LPALSAHDVSVVMPVFNEAAHLTATIDALVVAVERSGFSVELIVVDDGSTDGSADMVRHALGDRLPLTLVTQPNRGPWIARRAGLEAASREWVLLLDGRCQLDAEALAFVEARIAANASIWNGHVYVDTRGNPYGAFWNALAEIAWREYFDNPRTTSFGSDDFDHYPKGTGCFLAPRSLLLEAIAAFRTSYSDTRFVSDDTGLIRWLAERHRIHVSPGFSCLYAPRANLKAFLRQAVYRGSTFVDGHGRPESRFFPVAVAFFPVSAGLAVLTARRPSLLPALALGTSVAAACVATTARRSRFEVISFALLVPPYAVAHGLGMWRGLGMAVMTRVASDRSCRD
jgi:glycosyltransferase involved in cell wall biosynthesis